MNSWDNFTFMPNREAICLAQGLTADCKEKKDVSSDVDELIKYRDMTNTKPPAETSKNKITGTQIAIGVGALLLVVGTIIYLKKKK